MDYTATYSSPTPETNSHLQTLLQGLQHSHLLPGRGKKAAQASQSQSSPSTTRSSPLAQAVYPDKSVRGTTLSSSSTSSSDSDEDSLLLRGHLEEDNDDSDDDSASGSLPAHHTNSTRGSQTPPVPPEYASLIQDLQQRLASMGTEASKPSAHVAHNAAASPTPTASTASLSYGGKTSPAPHAPAPPSSTSSCTSVSSADDGGTAQPGRGKGPPHESSHVTNRLSNLSLDTTNRLSSSTTVYVDAQQHETDVSPQFYASQQGTVSETTPEPTWSPARQSTPGAEWSPPLAVDTRVVRDRAALTLPDFASVDSGQDDSTGACVQFEAIITTTTSCDSPRWIAVETSPTTRQTTTSCSPPSSPQHALQLLSQAVLSDVSSTPHILASTPVWGPEDSEYDDSDQSSQEEGGSVAGLSVDDAQDRSIDVPGSITTTTPEEDALSMGLHEESVGASEQTHVSKKDAALDEALEKDQIHADTTSITETSEEDITHHSAEVALLGSCESTGSPESVVVQHTATVLPPHMLATTSSLSIDVDEIIKAAPTDEKPNEEEATPIDVTATPTDEKAEEDASPADAASASTDCVAVSPPPSHESSAEGNPQIQSESPPSSSPIAEITLHGPQPNGGDEAPVSHSSEEQFPSLEAKSYDEITVSSSGPESPLDLKSSPQKDLLPEESHDGIIVNSSEGGSPLPSPAHSKVVEGSSLSVSATQSLDLSMVTEATPPRVEKRPPPPIDTQLASTPTTPDNPLKSLTATGSYQPRPIKNLIRRDLRSPDEVVVERALQQITIDCFYDASARSLIARSGGLLSIVTAMEDHASNPKIQIAACQALEKLALDGDNEQAVAELGGIETVLGAMMGHFGNIRVQEAAWSALQNLTCQNAALELSMDATPGSMMVLVQSLQQHGGHDGVAMHGAATLANLCIPKAARLEQVVQAKGMVLLATLLQDHWANPVARADIGHSLERLCASIAQGDGPC